MVAIATIRTSPTRHTVVKNHALMESIAKRFHESGITTPERAVAAQAIVRSLSKSEDVSQQVIYKALRERPGFASLYSAEGILKYYFEADLIMPIAKAQACDYYPRNLIALYESTGIRPDYEVKPEFRSSGVLTVPLLNSVGVDHMNELGLHSALDYAINNRDRKTYESVLSAIATMYKRLDDGSSPLDILED